MTAGHTGLHPQVGGWMKLPHKVRVKSKVSYEVVWSEQIGNDPTVLGECRADTRQILIKKGQSDTEAIKTFIHEVFHAMEFEYGFEIPHKAIHNLEHSVFKVLKLNRWL